MYVLAKPEEHSAVILEGHAEVKRIIHTFMENERIKLPVILLMYLFM